MLAFEQLQFLFYIVNQSQCKKKKELNFTNLSTL